MGLACSQRRGAPAPRIVGLGEAKASRRARTLGALQRLERIRDLLVEHGRDAADAHLVVSGRSGFDANVIDCVAKQPRAHLVTLHDLYGSR